MEKYSGWAPCFHDVEDDKKIIEWIKGFTDEETLDFYDKNKNYNTYGGGLLEYYVGMINGIGADVTLVSDMWTMTIAEGIIKGKEFKTEIQGDTFLLSAAETYRWWKEKYKEVTGEDYN